MENEILEINNKNSFPDFVFRDKIKTCYFFEMPIPGFKLLDLIDILNSNQYKVEYNGYFKSPHTQSKNKTILSFNQDNFHHLIRNFEKRKREIFWEYEEARIVSTSWEIYSKFHYELLVLGLVNNDPRVLNRIKGDPVWMKYHYSLKDLIQYFTDISTIDGAVDKDLKKELDKLRDNYVHIASSLY
jgi:hypothetical protein